MYAMVQSDGTIQGIGDSLVALPDTTLVVISDVQTREIAFPPPPPPGQIIQETHLESNGSISYVYEDFP